MQWNKTYIIVAALLLVMAAGTTVLVLKAPGRKGAAAAPAEAVGLNKPRAIALGKGGDLVVADSRNDRIEIRHPDGTMVKRFGRRGTGKGDFHEPCGVATDKDGNIFVADTFYTLAANDGLPWGRVEKFDASGSFQAEFGKAEGGNPNLYGPRAVAVDPQGRVWLSDTGNGRILVYDNAGKFVKEVGKKGANDLEFNEPFGIAFDSDGNAYVADRLNFRIQVIGPDFQFVRSFKVDAWESAQINQEPYVAVDSAKGIVWISDPTKNKVHRYSLKGAAHKFYDRGMDGPNTVAAFNFPTGLAVAPDSTLYITNGGTGRVLTLRP